MSRPLSPAAQAVLDAVKEASWYGEDDCLNDAHQIAAAALRAVLPHVLPLGDDTPWELMLARGRMLDIAAELEGNDD